MAKKRKNPTTKAHHKGLLWLTGGVALLLGAIIGFFINCIPAIDNAVNFDKANGTEITQETDTNTTADPVADAAADVAQE